MTDWQPTASIEMLKKRARLLSRLRAFFADRDVFEVQTPVLSHAGNTDPALESFIIQEHEDAQHRVEPLFLNTSPEFAMKRLLAAGSGSIYQIGPVFRRDECGVKHNPEFTMLEWYRLDFDHHALMGEVNALLRYVAEDELKLERSLFYSYRDAMREFAAIDPFTADIADLEKLAKDAGLEVVGMDNASKDDWLHLVMSHLVEKNLPEDSPVFIYDFPASQAALARIRPDNPPVAERFELYLNGMELANGFHELIDATEQQQRFLNEQQLRKQNGQTGIPADTNLLAALKAGLPECAGVAIGVDRLLMVLSGATHINEVVAFPFDRA